MSDALEIICWPDPRLKKVSRPVETFDEKLALLTVKMFELMRESRGVGLAAPQVGKNIRLFVMNHNGEPGSDRIYVNPVLSDADGDEEAEEGCLSLPKVNVMVVRSKAMRMTAMDLHGKPFEQIETGYIARIWQHEVDHLNGVLITDRMGPVAKMAHRKILRELEEKYAEEHPAPPPPRSSPSKKKKSRS
jgi:peptide deformylase